MTKDDKDNYKEQHSIIGDRLNAGLDSSVVPDDQLHTWALNTTMDLMNHGIMDKPTAQQAIQQIQTTQDPAALRTQIGQMAKVAQGAAATAAQNKEASETASNTAKARQENATAVLKEIEAKGLQGITPDYIMQTAQDPVTKQQALAAPGRGDVRGAKA